MSGKRPQEKEEDRVLKCLDAEFRDHLVLSGNCGHRRLCLGKLILPSASVVHLSSRPHQRLGGKFSSHCSAQIYPELKVCEQHKCAACPKPGAEVEEFRTE